MGKTCSNIVKRMLCTMLTIVGTAITVCAQNNPQRINDKLYPMYVKAYNMRMSAASLPIADSLCVASIASGDRYGEVYALSIHILYDNTLLILT